MFVKGDGDLGLVMEGKDSYAQVSLVVMGIFL